MTDTAARRLAAMLTETQRAQIVLLAQVIVTDPATTAGTPQAQPQGA